MNDIEKLLNELDDGITDEEIDAISNMDLAIQGVVSLLTDEDEELDEDDFPDDGSIEW